jgi:trk system potassium uptake protein TrkH
MGLDLPSASSTTASALGNVGSVIGASAGTYSFIPPLGKILLILCMWLGRLEIFAATIIFFPSIYKS